jgi:8-oxo-dGTP pyrophosphatase MutT (NUDIX family)
MPSSKPALIRQHSAGGVVVRPEKEPREYLAIQPAHRDGWRLPKGTIDRGETPQEAAVREVREEGGVTGKILAELGPIKFVYQMNGKRYLKTVDFYLMAYVAGDPKDHDHEVQDARWFRLADDARLAFPTERSLIVRARRTLETLSSGEIAT